MATRTQTTEARRGMTPAQLYALVFGAVLLLVGILGFFYESSFTSDEGDRDSVLGLFAINGWHNVVHIASGILGLLVFRSPASARLFALGFAIVYLAVTIWGFIEGDGGSILSVLPINTEDNVLHLLISLIGFGAYFASTDRDVEPVRARGA